MDTTRFLQMLDDAPDAGENTIAEVRKQLEEASRHHYWDVSGDGTRYVCPGTRHGVGFAVAYVEVVSDGRVKVTVDTGQRVSEENRASMRKLLAYHSDHFKVPGFELSEEGVVLFVTKPFSPTGGRFGVDRVVGLALSSVHAYSGMNLALAAGVEPWRLMSYDDDEGDDGDGDDGERKPAHEAPKDAAQSTLAERLRALTSRL